MSDADVEDLDFDPPPRPAPAAAPPRPLPGVDRTISPVAGPSTVGRGGKLLALGGLVVGCGVFLLATGSHPKSRKPPPVDNEPARQVVDFDSVRTPAPADRAVAAVAPGAAVEPGAAAAGSAPSVGGAVETKAAAVDPAQAAQAALQAVRAAPLIAYGAQAAAPAADPAPGGVAAAAAPADGAGDHGTPGELDGLRRGSVIGLARARRLPDRNFLLVAGALIPCVLETALDSSAPGYVTCRISRDVYSDNGAVVLLEKGSRVLGEYRSGFQQGRARIFVLWDRITTPGGVAVDVASPAADALGRAGFDGRIDSHFWTRFSGALLLTTLDGALSAAAARDAPIAAFGRPADDAASIALQNSVSIPPTLTKPQGAQVGVFISRDLDFSGVYALGAR